MHRRRLLRATGIAIGSLALAGCSTEPEEETAEEPDGSGPTDDSTTTRRSTDEIRSTTTFASSTDEVRSTTTVEETEMVTTSIPTETPPTTGEEDS